MHEASDIKVSEATNIEINVSDAFQVTTITSNEGNEVPETNETSVSEQDISLIETTDENLQEFWQKESSKSQDTSPISELKRAKKWAVEADPSLVKEYEKIKQNLAFKVKYLNLIY